MSAPYNPYVQLPLTAYVRACIALGLPCDRSYRAFKAGGGYCLPIMFVDVWDSIRREIAQ